MAAKDILVVDNNPVVLRMLSVFLRDLGHRVMAAEDGMAALGMLDEFVEERRSASGGASGEPGEGIGLAPDLAIIDLVMPKISGDKLCRIIRSRPELASMSLVVYSDLEDESFVLAVGADVCIAKGPFRATEHHLNEILDHLDKGTLHLLSGRLVGGDQLYKRQITAELLSSKHHYEHIFDSMMEGIIEVDSEGHICHLNAAALKFCGKREEDLLGRDFFTLFTPSDGARLRRLLASVVEECGRSEYPGSAPFVSGKSGGTVVDDRPTLFGDREVSLEFLPVREENGLFLVAIMRDLSERRRFEMELRRSNAELEQFAYSISHDLRQPLRMISGHLQLLERGLLNSLNETQRDHFFFAADGARRMDQMIVSLLEYAKLGHESKERLPSKELVDEARRFLAADIDAEEVEISVLGEWPEVELCRWEMVRLFQNLLGNALKYRSRKRPLRLEILSTTEEENWRVEVRDNGLGMDPGQLDTLFHFFSRLDNAGEIPGTGMGLALSRRIVENHQGRIWAQSPGIDQGSTFIFEIPLGSRRER